VLWDDARQFDATYEAVIDDKPLRSVLACSLNRKDFDLIDKFLKHNGSQRLHRHKLSYCSDETSRRVLCGIETFNLVPKIEHLLLEFFLLDLVFVRQSHISDLLDCLIVCKSFFTETALKKAIEYNKRTYKKLCELILSVKNSDYYSAEYMRGLWANACKQDFDFFENGDIVMFRAIYSRNSVDGIVTNVAHVTKMPTTPILKHLAEELNTSYDQIKNLKDNLKEL